MYIWGMEQQYEVEILDLGPAIDTLKSLANKFRESGDYMYMMEILLIIDEMDSPLLVDLLDAHLVKARA